VDAFDSPIANHSETPSVPELHLSDLHFLLLLPPHTSPIDSAPHADCQNETVATLHAAIDHCNFQSTLGSLSRAAEQTREGHPNSSKNGLFFRASPAGGCLERPSSYQTAHTLASQTLSKKKLGFALYFPLSSGFRDKTEPVRHEEKCH